MGFIRHVEAKPQKTNLGYCGPILIILKFLVDLQANKKQSKIKLFVYKELGLSEVK
jgi:hypothetical protein